MRFGYRSAAAPFCQGLNVRRSSGGSGCCRLQSAAGIPSGVTVSRRGEARDQHGIAGWLWEPAEGRMRRSRHFLSPGNWGPCLGARAEWRPVPRAAHSGQGCACLDRLRSIPRLLVSSQVRRARGLREARAAEARPNVGHRSARPFPSGAALIGRPAASPHGKAAPDWWRQRVGSRRAGPQREGDMRGEACPGPG